MPTLPPPTPPQPTPPQLTTPQPTTPKLTMAMPTPPKPTPPMPTPSKPIPAKPIPAKPTTPEPTTPEPTTPELTTAESTTPKPTTPKPTTPKPTTPKPTTPEPTTPQPTTPQPTTPKPTTPKPTPPKPTAPKPTPPKPTPPMPTPPQPTTPKPIPTPPKPTTPKPTTPKPTTPKPTTPKPTTPKHTTPKPTTPEPTTPKPTPPIPTPPKPTTPMPTPPKPTTPTPTTPIPTMPEPPTPKPSGPRMSGESLICTVSVAGQDRLRIPPDGICNFLFYDSLYSSQGDTLLKEPGPQLLKFLGAAAISKDTDHGCSVDINDVRAFSDHLLEQRGKKKIIELAKQKIIDYGFLTLDHSRSSIPSIQEALSALKAVTKLVKDGAGKTGVTVLGIYSKLKTSCQTISDIFGQGFIPSAIVILGHISYPDRHAQGCHILPPNLYGVPRDMLQKIGYGHLFEDGVALGRCIEEKIQFTAKNTREGLADSQGAPLQSQAGRRPIICRHRKLRSAPRMQPG
ncbi:uncharacterized protein LOC119455572 [Dermacentor silvarum]|uniref:uncharacterized protein LOC119455572 n=1 Tax=Dermacentor silvarum TaxID=543639 RepID=UPI0021013A7E|nr:uncharacterized protein LOC119455572 [Dermacentor silvarum]